MQVVGWRLVNQGSSDGAGLKLQCDWVLRDSDSVNELYSRIAKVAEATSYEHEIQTLENNKVRIEVWTPAIGELLLILPGLLGYTSIQMLNFIC